jgi:tetratricopeptide (TPR) repeat protein
MLVNYRPDYAHPWGSKTYYTQLRLDPLGKESAEEMLMALLGDGKDLLPLKHLIIDRTEGNPFFMEEIKEALFDQGVLTRNGAVKLAKPMNAVRLPPTVQGVLASRIDRLDSEQKGLLQTLAVIGKEFRLSLIRKVAGKADDELELTLSELQLAEFIYEQPAVSDIEYHFKHALTQEVGYGLLLSERRKELHRRIAAAIESLHGEWLGDHYRELAYHYGRGGDNSKAVHYLYLAGEQSLQRSAYAEALTHLNSGLEVRKGVLEGPARDAQELQLQLALGGASSALSGFASTQTEAALSRAYELSRQCGETVDVLRALGGLGTALYVKGTLHWAREVFQESLQLAHSLKDRAQLARAHVNLGMVLIPLAELAQARESLERALGLHGDFQRSDQIVALPIPLPLQLGRALWLLGLPDQALKRTREAELLGRRSTDPIMKGNALAFTQDLHVWCRDLETVREHALAVLAAPWAAQLARSYVARADLFHGWLLAREGQAQGVTLIRDAMARWTSTRAGNHRSMHASLLAEACASVGRIDEAMIVLDETLPFAETEEHYYEAELHRLRGELFLMRTDADREAAERCFYKAIDIARRQCAKSWELRATTSLARLLVKQGKRVEARTMLADIYNWFTEGFHTADLKDAKALLDELNQ